MTYALCGEENNLRKYALYDRKVQRSTVVIVVTNNASNNHHTPRELLPALQRIAHLRCAGVHWLHDDVLHLLINDN